jgi:hypothetical protein
MFAYPNSMDFQHYVQQIAGVSRQYKCLSSFGEMTAPTGFGSKHAVAKLVAKMIIEGLIG